MIPNKKLILRNKPVITQLYLIVIKQFFISILFLSLLFTHGIEVVIVKDYYPTGILKSERTYKDDLLDGPYTYYRSNGTIYKKGSMKYLPPTYTSMMDNSK